MEHIIVTHGHTTVEYQTKTELKLREQIFARNKNIYGKNLYK